MPRILAMVLVVVVLSSGVRTRPVVDAMGHSIDASVVPERIVSLSPNVTEMLFALGIGTDRIVGVTRFCDYPRQATLIKQVGGIVDPSVEGILSLRPDLVLVTRGNPEAVIERLRKAGITVFALESQDGCGRIASTMRELLLVAHPPDSSLALARIRQLEEDLEVVRQNLPPPGGPKTVFFYDPMSPDWTTGPGTHLSEVIHLAGGQNLFDDAPLAWPRVSLDAVVGRQPEWVCIAAAGEDSMADRQVAATWRARLLTKPGWRGLAAVREGRICVIPADLIMRPGPRIVLAIQRLARCLHGGPEGMETGR